MPKYFDYWHSPAALYGQYVNFVIEVLPLGLCQSRNAIVLIEIRSPSQLLHLPLSYLVN